MWCLIRPGRVEMLYNTTRTCLLLMGLLNLMFCEAMWFTVGTSCLGSALSGLAGGQTGNIFTWQTSRVYSCSISSVGTSAARFNKCTGQRVCSRKFPGSGGSLQMFGHHVLLLGKIGKERVGTCWSLLDGLSRDTTQLGNPRSGVCSRSDSWMTCLSGSGLVGLESTPSQEVFSPSSSSG